MKGLRTNERAPGTKVRLTGAFLRSTGQMKGGEGSKRWTIVESSCSFCALGFVAVDEPFDASVGYEDLAPEERPKWRHIHAGNMQVVGGKPKASDYP